MVLLRAGLAIVSIIVAAVLVRPAVSEYLSQRRPLTEENLRRAAAVTAEDAGYLLALAGLSEAGTVGTDPKETPALYRAALMRNPADGRAWIGLARSLRNTGAGREEIIHVLRRALILERSNPDVIWYAGVLALQEQEFAFGAKIFRRYLAVVPEDQGKVYALFRTLRAPTAFVIENLIPENPKYPAGYFDYLISNKLADEAREFWAWFGNMHPGKAAYVAYASFLIDQGEIPMALQVWNEFADALELRGRGRKGDSILWNGGFDLPFENSGFDWRSSAVQGATVRRDIDEKFEGDASLRVSLKDRAKTGDAVVLQVVPVQERAKYRLSGYIRQQRQGLSLLVSGRDCPPFTKKVSSQGAKDSWSKVGLDFETPRGCRTVQVQIVAEGVPPAEEEMTGWVDALEMVRTRL